MAPCTRTSDPNATFSCAAPTWSSLRPGKVGHRPGMICVVERKPTAAGTSGVSLATRLRPRSPAPALRRAGCTRAREVPVETADGLRSARSSLRPFLAMPTIGLRVRLPSSSVTVVVPSARRLLIVPVLRVDVARLVLTPARRGVNTLEGYLWVLLRCCRCQAQGSRWDRQPFDRCKPSSPCPVHSGEAHAERVALAPTQVRSRTNRFSEAR
jgi:hypothetical protein